ncbi:RNase H-like domain found in reverse transcriptase [Popillia japonica]|uniref:RNA-directed DNA polymerase n=1 Tax=Popillia japonica TaxID=7064 RepID=A0AAW1HYH0_POPJA
MFNRHSTEISLIRSSSLTEEIITRRGIRINKMDLVATNQKKIGSIQQRVCLEGIIGSKTYTLNFYIFDNMQFDCIMGIDNIRKLNLTINFEEENILIQDNIVKMEEVSSEGIHQFKMVEELEEDDDDKVSRNGSIEDYEDNLEETDERFNVDNREFVTDDLNELKLYNSLFDIEMIEEVVRKIDINNEELKEKLKETLWKNRRLFNEEVTFAKDYQHIIEVEDHSPLKCRNYPIPYQFKEAVEKEIQKLLEQGIIERSNSYFISPVVIVKKSNNSLRLCLDAREINQRIKPGYEAPLNIDVLITKCAGRKIFSKLDLKSAFWLIQLSPESRKYCAFSINGNIYQFRVAPFGIKSSPSALIRFLHRILNPFEQFYQSRVQEIREFPRPKRLKSLRSFLGLLNYYKKFIPKYSSRTVPLNKLLCKGVRWSWTNTEEEAFQELKNAFADTLLLYHPQFDKEFILRCDASHTVVAAELVQFQNGKEVPIHFISRTLKPTEIRYTISEKEMLAVIFSVTKLRYFLLGKKFTIETDHIALTTMMEHKFTNGRLYRWSILLAEYDFEIKYRPGKHMIAADVISRKNEVRKHSNVLIAHIHHKQNPPM